MADDETESEEEAEPTVELGEGPDVEGAPVARIAARLTWPQEASRVREKEGGATIRTPGGPRTIDDVLDAADETYFDTRQAFVEAVRGVVGTGPVKTVEE